MAPHMLRGLAFAPLVVPGLILIIWFPLSVYLSGIRAALSGILAILPLATIASYLGLFCFGLPTVWLLRRTGVLSRASLMSCGAVCGALVLAIFAMALSRWLGAYLFLNHSLFLQVVSLGAILGAVVASIFAPLSGVIYDAE